LHEVYSASPLFGIKFSVEDKPQALAERKVDRKMDDVEIIEDDHYDALAAYYADGDKEMDRDPEYNKDLGLAVEKLREGVTVEELWQV